jgi:hypothetical protein
MCRLSSDVVQYPLRSKCMKVSGLASVSQYFWDFRFWRRRACRCWYSGLYALRMEAVCSSETLVSTHESSRRYNREDSIEIFFPLVLVKSSLPRDCRQTFRTPYDEQLSVRRCIVLFPLLCAWGNFSADITAGFRIFLDVNPTRGVNPAALWRRARHTLVAVTYSVFRVKWFRKQSHSILTSMG